MVGINIDVGGLPIRALVDTGCAYPMVVPERIAEMLEFEGHAFKAGRNKAVLADGHAQDIDIVLIDSVTVGGRVLRNVETAVVASPDAAVLLGLGALNQIGPYKIEGDRIVFGREA
jgi:clan AA aspartic protease (TIGR02281 family)